MSRRAKYIILNVVFCSLFLVSCRESKVEKIQGVTLNKGAIIALNNGNYENYDLQEGKYSKIESEEIIRIYDEDSGNYPGTFGNSNCCSVTSGSVFKTDRS